MTLLICSDRDGTISEDNDYFLGKDDNWKEQLRILPGVVEGVILLNDIPGSRFFVVSNQSGVAISNPEFSQLTEERVREVHAALDVELALRGAHVLNYFSCPFVDHVYARKAAEKGRTIHPHYLRENHPDMKPRIGMLEQAARACGKKLEACTLFVIGDRLTDVETGLNGGGTSILIESPKTRALGDVAKVHKLMSQYRNRVYIKPDFLSAARRIVRLYTSN